MSTPLNVSDRNLVELKLAWRSMPGKEFSKIIRRLGSYGEIMHTVVFLEKLPVCTPIRFAVVPVINSDPCVFKQWTGSVGPLK